MRRALGEGAQCELRAPRELAKAFWTNWNRIAFAPFIVPAPMSGNRPPQLDWLAIDFGGVPHRSPPTLKARNP
jgi:hypothetical protein